MDSAGSHAYGALDRAVANGGAISETTSAMAGIYRFKIQS